MSTLKELKWKNHPYLVLDNFKLRGLRGIGRAVSYNTDNECFDYELFDVHKDNATLISRTIESLTDEEVDEIPSYKDLLGSELRFVTVEMKREWLNDAITQDELTAQDFIYLLSLGIWVGSAEGVTHSSNARGYG